MDLGIHLHNALDGDVLCTDQFFSLYLATTGQSENIHKDGKERERVFLHWKFFTGEALFLKETSLTFRPDYTS